MLNTFNRYYYSIDSLPLLRTIVQTLNSRLNLKKIKVTTNEWQTLNQEKAK